MPNPNYIKGVKKERKIVNEARQQGNISFRSAGSHSPIDVIIIDPVEKIIRLIQCKPDDYPESKVKKILNEMSEINNQPFFVSFEVL